MKAKDRWEVRESYETHAHPCDRFGEEHNTTNREFIIWDTLLKREMLSSFVEQKTAQKECDILNEKYNR